MEMLMTSLFVTFGLIGPVALLVWAAIHSAEDDLTACNRRTCQHTRQAHTHHTSSTYCSVRECGCMSFSRSIF